jgi:hypothetical protein
MQLIVSQTAGVEKVAVERIVSVVCDRVAGGFTLADDRPKTYKIVLSSNNYQEVANAVTQMAQYTRAKVSETNS